MRNGARQFVFEADLMAVREILHDVLVCNAQLRETRKGNLLAVVREDGRTVARMLLDGAGNGAGFGIDEDYFGDAPVVIDARRGRNARDNRRAIGRPVDGVDVDVLRGEQTGFARGEIVDPEAIVVIFAIDE